MNSIKKFVALLEDKRMKEAWVEMTLILKESHQYFQNIPTSERGLILNVLFNERNGLLTFLNYAVNRYDMDKSLEATTIEMFNLLIFVMSKFSDVYLPHIKATQAVCTLALTMKAPFYLKQAAAKAFVTLIKTFASASGLDFDDTITKWTQKFKFNNPTDRRLLLEVIAAIARYFPDTLAFARYAKAIRGQLMADIALMCDGTKKIVTHGLVTYIEAMNNMLYKFPTSNEDIGKSSGPDKLYERLKKLCSRSNCREHRQLVTAILNLLTEHLALFDEFVYEDHEFWHDLLKFLVASPSYGDESIKALRMYYKTMGAVLGRKHTENDKRVFLNLQNSFKERLSNGGSLSSTDLRLAVYGYSHIIEPCSNYFADAGVEEMFSLIAHCTIPRYAREDDEAVHFEEIADYQEALSRIIRYMSNVTINQIRALTTLCSLLIKRFPELAIADQEYATASLNRTIVNVRYSKEILYQDFISHIIYDGIVWSCSHMLLIDAELNEDVEKSSEKRPITYKDYVSLWLGLLDPANYASSGENSEVCAIALQTVVDETITTCITLMNTLNLNLKAKENNIFSNVKVSQTVENESDFRIFVNLVDLYVEILANVEPFLWTNTIQRFLYEIIKNSYKNPLISGFYKLAKVVFISSGYFDSSIDVSEEIFNLILRYLCNTLDTVAQYPPELQISCLQLILNVPEVFIVKIVDRAARAFKISFAIGLTNYEVASVALDALERWTKYLGTDCPQNFVSELIPSLEKFLQSEETSVQLLHDFEDRKRRTEKKVTLLSDDLSVEAFQKRILLFFGSLNGDTMLRFIHANSLKTGATWSKNDILKYSPPLPDVNLEINLDAMLPRIIELALSSGDRRTRVNSSEVLHTIVAMMVGKTAQSLGFDRDSFTPLYEILCPALLKLGSDSDSVIAQLYNPLTMQITHWLSSTLMLDSRATVHLVDSLFDGLGDETNSSLRDVCGIYLAEFVRWSIKQSTDRDLALCPTNINLIVQRIINFALDPSLNKRVAAAIGFNHLYRILRESEEIVNIFWLEILRAFVKSLEGCDDSRIRDALRHVERVLIDKSQVFNDGTLRRLRPSGFKGKRLKDAATWIFEQCGTLDRGCRKNCIKLFESVSRNVEGFKSARAIIDGYLKDEGLEGLNEIVLGNLNEKFRTFFVEDLEKLLKTLDLYVWLLREKLVENETLFSELNHRRNVVYVGIAIFVNSMLIVNYAVENSTAFRQEEFVRSKSLRCEIALQLFDFLPLLINVKNKEQDFVPDDVFSEELFKLVSACVLEPHKVGFDSSNLQLTEKLPTKLEELINSALRNFKEETINKMKNVLANDIQRFSGKLFQFNEIISNKLSISEKSIKGLILLHKCILLKSCTGCHEITANASATLTHIFGTLSTEELGQNVCYDPKLETKSYFEHLLELLLLEYNAETMKTLLKLLTSTATLYRSDLRTTVTHGEYFLSVYKDAIIRGCLRDLETTLNLLENLIHENPENVLRITEALVLYLKRQKIDYQGSLDEYADLVIKKFGAFERAVNNLEHRRNVFLNIYAIVVRLKKAPLDVLTQRGDIYLWILKELVACNSFKYKIRLLRDFLVCLTNENSNENPELTAILYGLKNERRVAGANETSGIPAATPETLDCFHNLLKLLLITKSSIVFDAVMNFAEGEAKLLCDDKVTEYLKLYFSGIPRSNVLKSLELAYKRFMDANETNDRFDVLLHFLLPSFGHCDPQTMETFFERNIREIYSLITQKPTEVNRDRQRLFVSKIGCYNLVEIMFAKLPNDRIDSNNCPLAINTGNTEVKLSKLIFRSTLPIRQLRALENDDPELFRRLQCAAYNCSIAIVSMARDDHFYVAVFGENREKHQLIWENIVDVKRRYELRQTSTEYPKKRKKLVNIRKNEREKKKHDHYSYIKSYDLATSTLSENICAYDLNAVNLAPIDGAKENETMSLILEIDAFNDHECMAPICGLLIHMLDNKISQSIDVEIAKTLPKWMSLFRNSMLSEHANVRLFLLKIVLNTQPVFKPYAQFFLEPIIHTINLSLKDSPLNYVVTDALVMLVDWRDVYVPKRSERCGHLARLMFAQLVEKATEAPTKHIVNYNVSIIEMIVDAWHESLTILEDLKDRMSAMDPLAVKLILIFLTKRMTDGIIDRKDVWDYLEKCLANWKIQEESVLKSFEAVGLMLRHSQSSENFDELKTKIVEIARTAFRGMLTASPERLVKCVHALCKACPELTEEFFQFVSSSQLRVAHIHVAKCLEVFMLMIPKISPENIVKELNYMKFNSLLENKVLSCEKICLKIVEQLVPILEPRDLLPMIEFVGIYADHKVPDYRKICYETSTKLYERYSGDTSGKAEILEIMKIGKRILLQGLLDPTEDIQKMAANFWSDLPQMRNTFAERLLDILDCYTPGVEKNFLQIMTLLLLNPTTKSLNYEDKMFKPLHDCSYHDHNISVSWKRRNFESRIPLFAPSLASQLDQRFTHYSYAISSASGAQDFHDDFMLRATNAPQQFEATFLGERSLTGNLTKDTTFAVPKVPEVTRNEVSRRFLANWSDASPTTMRKNRDVRKFAEEEYRREFEARQRNSVKLYRKYRIGDFPDTEISHAMFLGPMHQLVKRDSTICKYLIVGLIRSLIDRMKASGQADRYCSELSEKLVNVLKKRKGNGAVIPAIFEILFNVPELDFPWEIVTEVAKTDALFAQGALLTERSLIDNVNEDSEPPAKRSRIDDDPLKDENTDRWIDLADLYESMNDVDVALSIFRGEMFDDDLHSASAARAASDWERAENSYCKAFGRETSARIKRHCLEGMFECMSRLSKWRKLESEIDTKVKPNFTTLLERDDTLNEKRFAPWIFRTHTRRFLDGKPNNAFTNALQSYLQDATKRQRLTELFDEEIAVLTINVSSDISRDFLNASSEKIREKWIELSPLDVSLRSAAIFRLQGIHDIDCYLKTIESSDIVESSRGLLNSWENSGPTIGDDLLAWDKHLSYRSYFTSCLINKLNGANSQESGEIVEKLRSINVEKMLKLVYCALDQRNDQVAKKYLRNIEPDIANCGNQALVDEFELHAVRCKFLNAETCADRDKSLRYYAASWEKAHELLNTQDLSESSQIAVRQIVSAMASSFANLSNDRPEFFETLWRQSKIIQSIFTERIDFDRVADTLNDYSFNNLKKCCEFATENGECFLRLSKYCYERISMLDGDTQVSREFVRATLKAMSCGSDEATHYFPCLLREELLADEETRRIFHDESSKIETWRFLVWQTQLLSHLGTAIGNTVLPIVRKMVKEYPNALAYSLRLTLDTKPHLRDDFSILSLNDLLEDKKELDRFLEALQYVVQPELYLEYQLKELVRNLSKGRATIIDSLVKKVYPIVTRDDCSLQGNVYRAIAPYKQEIERITEMPVENIVKHVAGLLNRLKQQSLNKRTNQTKLKYYSPWLSEFVGRDIEVPGQYNGETKPMPRYHARIVKIESAVKVMQSKRKPIRITLVANNAKNYRFLVKFGEDLRLDQRVEQIFGVMNKTLKADISCSQRRLSIDTYQVFPLSGSLGFLQWVEGTKTLNDCVLFSLDKKTKESTLLPLLKKYEEWIAKAALGKDSSTQYKKAMLKYSSNDVLAKMTDFGEKVGSDLLRRTFILMCPSMESFVSLRRNFVTSYATMCIAQWILGIGDRHLGNTLIDVESGRSLGIDFGSAFGGAIDQAVPELVPFRMTPQIIGLLRPFNVNDLMGATMTHVLRALRNGKGPLMACLNGVAYEQLNWEEHVNRLSQEMQDEIVDIKWLPAKKVAVVSKKLNGGKPSSIMLEQLAERHSDKDYFYRYTAVVNGTDSDDKSRRSLLKEENLSPEEQVQCLMEQATDLNILGRMYAGWSPWL